MNYLNEKKRIQNVYKDYMNPQYSKKWSNVNIGNRYMRTEIIKLLSEILTSPRNNLSDKKILEIGCAGGDIIQLLIDLGAEEKNISGIDIRQNRLKDCKKIFPKSKINYMDARKLNFDDNSFDVITVFTFFSSLLNENYQNEVSSELIRVLKPKGIIVYYDFRYDNPFNPNVIGINKNKLMCFFKNMSIDINLITLIPPLARSLGVLNRFLYSGLSFFPFLKSHYLAIVQK